MFTKKKDPSEYYYEKESTITHYSMLLDLNKLFDITRHRWAIQMDILDLKWILYCTKIEKDRVERADYNVPILVTKEKAGYVVLDGVHRLKKAYNEQLKIIKVKLVTQDELFKAMIEWKN